MADRRLQVIFLIGSRFDFSFEPETFTGKVVRRGAKPRGRVPRRAVCADCQGAGERRGRGGVMARCARCDGRGWTTVDAYTGDPVEVDDGDRFGTPFGMSFSEHFTRLLDRDTVRVKCPDCQTIAGDATGLVHGERCRRCDGSGLAAVAGSWLSPPAGERLEGDAEAALLNQISRRDAAGHYRELEEALAGISRHVNKPERFLPLTMHAVRARRLLDGLYLPPVTVVEADLAPFDLALVELALAYIEGRMPDPIRVPAAVVANRKLLQGRRTVAKRSEGSSPRALLERDREIRNLVRDGKGPQWVAQAYGLHVSTVYSIVSRKESVA